MGDRYLPNGGQQRAQAADTFARQMAPLFAELETAGFVDPYSMAQELNRRGLRSRLGSCWVPAAIYKLWRRMIDLGALNSSISMPGRGARYYSAAPTRHTRMGVDRSRQALRDRADDFARAMAPLVSALRSQGHTTYRSIADALNAQGAGPQRGQRWSTASVKNLCMRLKALAERSADNPAEPAP